MQGYFYKPVCMNCCMFIKPHEDKIKFNGEKNNRWTHVPLTHVTVSRVKPYFKFIDGVSFLPWYIVIPDFSH